METLYCGGCGQIKHNYETFGALIRAHEKGLIDGDYFRNQILNRVLGSIAVTLILGCLIGFAIAMTAYHTQINDGYKAEGGLNIDGISTVK